MTRAIQGLAIAAIASVGSVALADVPFQPLADFGRGSSPYDVNASGVIVGLVSVERPNGVQFVPALWQTPSSQPTELPSVQGGYASAINSDGVIVGTELQSGVFGVAAVWTDGQRVVLPDLGEGGSATDINDAGVIVGSVILNGEYRAARWVNGQLDVLPLPEFDAPDGVIWSFAESINSSGVITGTVRAPSSTPSVAVRWDSEGVEAIPSGGLETKGISVDNLGGVLINGYFDGGASRAPAIVQPDGGVQVLATDLTSCCGAVATTMSRNGIVGGYYYSNDEPGNFIIKGVAWVDGVFTPLTMPAGQRFAFPGGVGSNGLVFGYATDGVTGRSIGGYWDVGVEQTTLRSTVASGSPGQTVELSVESFRASGANVGHSVAARVQGALLGQGITDATGRARISVTIPSSITGTQMVVRYTDENGAVVDGVVNVTPGCRTADLNCDGTVNGVDLTTLLAQWGTSGSADLNRDGSVNGLDLSIVLAAWGT